jgi:hypothetical protein
MHMPSVVAAVLLAAAVGLSPAISASEEVDATDPTKIYTYAGAGLKYADYTNDESMVELRATGNVGLSAADMILFEFGYGWHDGDLEPGSNSGFTNVRVRWFHLFEMDYDLIGGYRGLGTEVDVQLAGGLKGTDGQNLVAAGLMPVFNINPNWNLYLSLNAVSTWDKRWENWNGAGIGVTPRLIFSPDTWWAGAQVQITPTYNYFVVGELQGDGAGNIDINVGGAFNPVTMWDVTYQLNVDEDLKTFRRGTDQDMQNDWNVFVNVTTYF